MSSVIAELSVSLDGFTTGPNVRIGNEMGDDGERLHEWMFPADGPAGIDAEVREDMFRTSGAVVMGRRMFDLGLEPWGDDPPFHMPVFVVTHRAGDPIVKQGGTTYHFVTGGLEPTLERARAAAGDRDVVVMGGADVIGQCLGAGLVDELRLHLVPVLLGGGARLFDGLDPRRVSFEIAQVLHSPHVTHLRYAVRRTAGES